MTKVEIRFEVETDQAEMAYDAAFTALADIFGTESVKGDEPRIVEEEDS